MMQFDCIIHPSSSFSQCISAVCGPLIEIKPITWDGYRKDENGDPLLDKNGDFIVDAHIIYRDKKGGNIIRKQIIKIEPDMLFD